VGDVFTVKIISALMGLFEKTIKALINTVLSKGFSLEYLFQLLHIDFITFEEVALEPFDDYFLFFLTPAFNITTALGNLQQGADASLQSLFSENEYTVAP